MRPTRSSSRSRPPASRRERPSPFPAARAAVAAVPWAAACLLKPVLWVTVPVFAPRPRLSTRAGRFVPAALRALGVFAARPVSPRRAQPRFSTARSSRPATGRRSSASRRRSATGFSVSSSRRGGASSSTRRAVVAGLLGLRRRPARGRVLCAGAPLLHLLVVARWWSWEGGTAWGPRHLLPVLPLLVAPAALVTAGAVRAAFLAGALVNLPGVLVSPGSWDGYAERLRPPAGASWADGGTRSRLDDSRSQLPSSATPGSPPGTSRASTCPGPG